MFYVYATATDWSPWSYQLLYVSVYNMCLSLHILKIVWYFLTEYIAFLII